VHAEAAGSGQTLRGLRATTTLRVLLLLFPLALPFARLLLALGMDTALAAAGRRQVMDAARLSVGVAKAATAIARFAREHAGARLLRVAGWSTALNQARTYLLVHVGRHMAGRHDGGVVLSVGDGGGAHTLRGVDGQLPALWAGGNVRD
jgi:hypothetical protein